MVYVEFPVEKISIVRLQNAMGEDPQYEYLEGIDALVARYKLASN